VSLATTPAPARTLGELEQALTRPPPQITSFVEYRFSRLLKRPTISSGTLEYRDAGVWVRAVDSPRQERAEIEHDELRVRRADGTDRRVSLTRAPQLRMLIDILGALLEGRLMQARDAFAVSLTSADEAWGLRLVPRDPALARKVARIDVFGIGDSPGCIEMLEADGDASFTILGGAASPPPMKERADVETQCRLAPIEHPAR
jgi:hypothetical protein